MAAVVQQRPAGAQSGITKASLEASKMKDVCGGGTPPAPTLGILSTLPSNHPIDVAMPRSDPYKRYTRFELLGQGAQKRVYKAFDEEEGMEVAWNQVPVAEFAWTSDKDRQRLFAEIKVLKQLKHKNVISLFDWWYDPRLATLNFITEIFMDGTLRQYRKKHKQADITVVKRWAWQILQGLVYLHGHNPPIIHRDLKSDNIFVHGSSGTLKIADLGFATLLSGISSAMSVIGTPEFMAPELYEEHYTEKVDVYSFGMVLLELATLEYPYGECRNPAQIYKKVTAGIPPQALERVANEELKAFITTCTCPDPAKRPESRQLLKHSFFDIIRSPSMCCLSSKQLPSRAASPLQPLPSVNSQSQLPAQKPLTSASTAARPQQSGLPSIASASTTTLGSTTRALEGPCSGDYASPVPAAAPPGRRALSTGGACESLLTRSINSPVSPTTHARSQASPFSPFATHPSQPNRRSHSSTGTAADLLSTGGWGTAATTPTGSVGDSTTSSIPSGPTPVPRRTSSQAGSHVSDSHLMAINENAELSEGDILFEQELASTALLDPEGASGKRQHNWANEDEAQEGGDLETASSGQSTSSDATSSSVVQRTRPVSLTIKGQQSAEHALSFAMSFTTNKGVRKRVGFQYDITEDTVDVVASEMVENLSLNIDQAQAIAELMQQEIVKYNQGKRGSALREYIIVCMYCMHSS